MLPAPATHAVGRLGQADEIARGVRDAGYTWVKVHDVKPAGAVTYRHVGEAPVQGRMVARKLTAEEGAHEIAAMPSAVQRALAPLAERGRHVEALDVHHDAAQYEDDPEVLAEDLDREVARRRERKTARYDHDHVFEAINAHTDDQ